MFFFWNAMYWNKNDVNSHNLATYLNALSRKIMMQNIQFCENGTFTVNSPPPRLWGFSLWAAIIPQSVILHFFSLPLYFCTNVFFERSLSEVLQFLFWKQRKAQVSCLLNISKFISTTLNTFIKVFTFIHVFFGITQ